ncbi:hypothetical protein [Bremerella alba]|uniref:Uncharacterized protein n=1 Tax=Bremerella alba TaxID=980252 RepID=A0A7V8V6F7_9BACT|nr:hypothetical protein [Bremerella alba]MBA2115834.1 hypothetical protein [Bremerella alba]
MIRLAPGFVFLALSSVALSAAAQDFTTQDPRYTTTPSEYTTTPAQYTTTPSEYTTTPPEYLPQADTVPDTDVTVPTIPDDLPDVGDLGDLDDDLLPTSPLSSTTLEAESISEDEPQFLQSVPVEDEQANARVIESDTTTESESMVALFAETVLRLDEEETQQFVTDYDEIVAELGLEPSEVGWSTRFKIVLYLTLGRLLGLFETELDAGAI